MGFRQGRASPCCFWHPTLQLSCVVHGDDFTATGSKRELDWFEAQLRARYELTAGGRLGPGKDDTKEASVLNRIIRWTDEGVEYEADPRQVERFLEELDLDGDGVKGVATPSVKLAQHQVESEQALGHSEHTRFRGLAARANYLAADRLDIIFAAKEVCRFMAHPSDLAMSALKRLGRYLKERPRVLFEMPFSGVFSH